MPVSSRSDSAKGERLEEDNFTTFDHAAAGHAGVLCSMSGSLVAKPCQQQEVDFYQSSILHPEFAEYIPAFIGTLSPAESAVTAAASLGAITPQSANPSPNIRPSHGPLTVADSASDTPLPAELSGETGQIPLSQPPAASDATWVPSEGRKIDSDVSIVLENVASGFKRPNVIDVKLGARLWGDDAVLDKRDKLDKVSRETTSGSLGFRIAGMKVWVGEAQAKKRAEQALGEHDIATPTDSNKHDQGSSKVKIVEVDGYRWYDKWYGRSFGQHDVKQAFETFLSGPKVGGKDNSKLVATRAAAGLRSIESVLAAEESRMYSSSILYIYEGDPEAFEDALAAEAREKEGEATTGKQAEEEEEEEPEELKYRSEGPQNGKAGSEFGDLVHVNVIDERELNLGKGLGLGFGAEATTFEGSEDEEEEEEEEEEPAKVDDIRLIDFAHASWTPGQGADENVLHGIRNLARIMEEIAGIDPGSV